MTSGIWGDSPCESSPHPCFLLTVDSRQYRGNCRVCISFESESILSLFLYFEHFFSAPADSGRDPVAHNIDHTGMQWGGVAPTESQASRGPRLLNHLKPETLTHDPSDPTHPHTHTLSSAPQRDPLGAAKPFSWMQNRKWWRQGGWRWWGEARPARRDSSEG